MTREQGAERDAHEHGDKPPTKRELQQPIGAPAADDSWLSGDEDDPLREEAAERAKRAVEPGRPRE